MPDHLNLPDAMKTAGCDYARLFDDAYARLDHDEQMTMDYYMVQLKTRRNLGTMGAKELLVKLSVHLANNGRAKLDFKQLAHHKKG